MNYESFKKDNPNFTRYLTIDSCVSCTMITIYVGFMGFFIYKFVKEYT